MSDHYDLLIRGGTLVDGTGAPARRGDLGIRDGLIVAMGEVSGTADRTLEAEGQVVSNKDGGRASFVDCSVYDAVRNFRLV